MRIKRDGIVNRRAMALFLARMAGAGQEHPTEGERDATRRDGLDRVQATGVQTCEWTSSEAA